MVFVASKMLKCIFSIPTAVLQKFKKLRCADVYI